MWMGFVPPLYPYFIKTVGLSTGLSSIKMNMICGERSSYGEERNAGRMLWSFGEEYKIVTLLT